MAVAALCVALVTAGPMGGPAYHALPAAPPPVVDDRVEISGELVHPTLALGWFIASGRAWCESGEQWHAHRDGFFQAIPPTWARYGGREFAPYAGEATADEQAIIFLRILDNEGPGAWTCGRGQP